MYIWQKENWTDFKYDKEKLIESLCECCSLQGRLLAKVSTIETADISALNLESLSEEIISNYLIEGENLNPDSVRSSIAKRLGVSADLTHVGQKEENAVQVLFDAVASYDKNLSEEMLCNWHRCFFPLGYSGLYKIDSGSYRTSDEKMQIVSGGIGHERVHYEAPPSSVIKNEMKKLIDWWNSKKFNYIDVGLAHIWFEIIHPFDDGNGRIGRVLVEMALSKVDNNKFRYYSLSRTMKEDKKIYYAELEKATKTADLTSYLTWFLGCVKKSLEFSIKEIDNVVIKSLLWKRFSRFELNARQKKVVNKLIDLGKNFEGYLTVKKYQSMTKSSTATASRDIAELFKHGILAHNQKQGRSSGYYLKYEE